MRVLVQYATLLPQDWTELDLKTLAQVRSMPRKPVPSLLSVIDGSPGWVNDVVVQGWHLRGCDHIALEPFNAGKSLRVYRWSDDLSDPEIDYRFGSVIEFRDGWVDRTVTFADGSSVRHQGPDQRMTQFAEDLTAFGPYAAKECGGLPVVLKPWSQWVAPPADLTFHGVRLPDVLFLQHIAKQRLVNWREWVA